MKPTRHDSLKVNIEDLKYCSSRRDEIDKFECTYIVLENIEW